ncbi:MAG: peptidylprolyl isomerase [Formosimonas sp.]
MHSLLKKLLMVALAAPVLAFAQTPANPAVQTLVLVAGEPITTLDVKERADINYELLQLAGKKLDDQQKQALLQKSYNELIEERVLLNQARKVGILTSESEVQKAITEVAQAQNISTEELKANIIKKYGEKAWDTFNRDIKTDLTTKALKKQEVLDKVQVSQSEIDSFLSERKLGVGNPIPHNEILEAQHIFVAKPTPASKKKIDAAKKRIDAGESFETVGAAVSQSNAPVTAVVAIVDNDTAADPAIRALIPKLTVGSVSEVIKTPNGFHLFKAVARKSDDFTLNEQNESAKEAITAKKFETAYKTWYENLINEAKKNVIEEVKK